MKNAAISPTGLNPHMICETESGHERKSKDGDVQHLEVVQCHNHFGLVVVVGVVLGVGGAEVLGKRLVRVCLAE